MELITTSSQASAADRWDDFVTKHPDSTFCHLHGWSRVFEDALGHECAYLTAVNELGETQGILPLVRVRSVLFGHHLVSMPFLNYGGDKSELLPAPSATLFGRESSWPLQIRNPIWPSPRG